MDLDRKGYTVLREVLPISACQTMAEQLESVLLQDRPSAIDGSTATATSRVIVGGRNLLSLWKDWRLVAHQELVSRFVSKHLGKAAGLVRGLYFDKPPGKGWALALHRDQTISVAQHIDPPDPFSKPTRKAGVPHVQASTELLSQMLTLRLHLDPMTDDNGPLVVIPGSHLDLESDGQATDQATQTQTIHCAAGDIFVMRPLLVHGSRAADPKTDLHRRVIHLEFAPRAELPGGYQWHNFEPIVS
ncbi:MAG: phytanoyl-CoA dioxygenase family protein [Planctomycetota bacterium]